MFRWRPGSSDAYDEGWTKVADRFRELRECGAWTHEENVHDDQADEMRPERTRNESISRA